MTKKGLGNVFDFDYKNQNDINAFKFQLYICMFMLCLKYITNHLFSNLSNNYEITSINNSSVYDDLYFSLL